MTTRTFIGAAVAAVLLTACSGTSEQTATTTADPPGTSTATAGSHGADVPTTAAPEELPTPQAPEPVDLARVRWSSEVRPVSGPVVVDGIPVLYTVEGESLQVTALDPEDGTELWSRPATPSLALAGVGLHVTTVDGLVAHYAAAAPGAAEEGWAVPVLRDPRTGEAVMTGETPMPFTRLPGECDFDEEVLCAEVAVEGGGRIVAWITQDGQLGQVPGREGWESVGPAGLHRRTGQVVGRFVDRELAWEVDLGEVVAPGASTNSGWHFQDHGDVIVASVGTTDDPRGLDAVDLTDYRLFALEADTGELRWAIDSASIFCDASLTTVTAAEDVEDGSPDTEDEVDPVLACVFETGRYRLADTDAEVRAEGLEASLIRVDPETGEELWRAELTPDGPVGQEGTIATQTLDAHHVVVLGTVVDVRDGSARPVEPSDQVWTESLAVTQIAVDGAEDEVRGNDRFPLPASVTLPAAPPAWPLPPHVGVELSDGSRLVAHDDGVVLLSAPTEG